MNKAMSKEIKNIIIIGTGILTVGCVISLFIISSFKIPKKVSQNNKNNITFIYKCTNKTSN